MNVLLKKRLLTSLVVVGICIGTLSFTSEVNAQTDTTDPEIAAMVAQIQQLTTILAQLQERLLIQQRQKYEDMHQTDTNIIHAESFVEATKRVTLYTEPAGSRTAGRQSSGDGGNVSDGPRILDGEVWWKVVFEDGDEGWVQEDDLERIPSVGIYSDVDGDGAKELVQRIFGDYRADRFILFPMSTGVVSLYIEEDMEMVGQHDDEYVTGQIDKTVDGPPAVLQSNPYISSEPLVKGENKSVPIAWQAKNVPKGAQFVVQVEATRLEDSPLSGGTWEGQALVGDSVGRYFWDIEGVGRIGAGDYRSQVRIKECASDDCDVIAESPHRYFTIVNP